MAEEYAKPKAYNRRFYLNLGSGLQPEWAQVAAGITARATRVSETLEQYFYMDNRGGAESAAAGQSVTRLFSGNRFLGDPAQDAILLERMYAMDRQEMEFLEFYDNMPEGPRESWGNGCRGRATVRISDDGSGGAGEREVIQFSLQIHGQPQRGVVALENDVPCFTPLAYA